MSINLGVLLREFHVKYGHYVSTKPSKDFPYMVKLLRHKLIKEEVTETFTAMGLITDKDDNVSYVPQKENIVEIADGIADAVYVLVGTAVSYGIEFERVFLEVHRSNMTKTAAIAEPGQKYGTKTPKGPDYIAPDISGILFHPELQTKLEKKHELERLEADK